MSILSSGVWEWRSGFGPSAIPSGTCSVDPGGCTSWWYGTVGEPFSWGFGYDGFTHLSLAAHAGTLHWDWAANGLYLDGVFQDPQSLPAGFRIHDAYKFHFSNSGPPASGEMHLNIEFTILGIDEDIYDFGSIIYDREFSGFGDNSTVNRLIWLGIGGWPITLTADNPAYPLWGGSHILVPTTFAPKFTGVYDIIYWWWRLPDVTACGEKNDDRHLIYAGDQPETPEGSFGEYEKLDPDDPDAFPQPIILSLNPNHGRAGMEIEITGEGFGDDANVQFDGADADDIIVWHQARITCRVPAHALGFANVAVINADGVSS